MATHLDLEEQEQLDQLKHFWNQYGNLITWLLVAALAVYAGWNGWQWWQRDQAGKAGSLYGAVEEAARSGDVERVSRAFLDIKDRFAGTVYAAQAALLASKVQFEKGKADDARATLQWAADNASEEAYREIARLRLAGAQLDAKQYDEALKTLSVPFTGQFVALAADRRGDVLQAQGKAAEAIEAYQQSYKALPETVDYRSLVEAKLVALGVAPAASAAP
jgi:predicted negative regulator of RcsB-dependent stress response